MDPKSGTGPRSGFADSASPIATVVHLNYDYIYFQILQQRLQLSLLSRSCWSKGLAASHVRAECGCIQMVRGVAWRGRSTATVSQPAPVTRRLAAHSPLIVSASPSYIFLLGVSWQRRSTNRTSGSRNISYNLAGACCTAPVLLSAISNDNPSSHPEVVPRFAVVSPANSHDRTAERNKAYDTIRLCVHNVNTCKTVDMAFSFV